MSQGGGGGRSRVFIKLKTLIETIGKRVNLLLKMPTYFGKRGHDKFKKYLII